MSRIGDIIDNKYEVLKEIGRGGMSHVYLAMDMRLNKQWAIKEIERVAHDKNNQVVVQSLLVEAGMMKKLDHPALPRIVDIIDNGKTVFVVMDYIEGQSLDQILEQNGAQPQELVIDWAKQLCDVLRYLHSQNPPIIYRDMKPANVMLKPEGNLKVIDFGIAREYKVNNIKDTVNLGTRGYAAPEQFGGSGQTDARTDIYCLGATLYHLVTGQNPGEPPYEIRPIREWNPGLSSGLEAIIIKCTQANPKDRYQSCEELMYALEHYTEADDSYRRKQKKRLGLFVAATAASLIFLTGGLVFRSIAGKTNNQDYEKLISVLDTTDYGEKISSYTEAIELYPYRTEAYIKMLEAYRDNGFGIAESQQFMGYYNKYFSENNSSNYDVSSNEFSELNYEAGITYFFSYIAETDEDYSYDDQKNFRVRALKAYPFFEEVKNNGKESYDNYNLAKSYFIICDFYKNYVGNATSVKEPTKEIYTDFVSSVQNCVEYLDESENDDISYVKLVMYSAIIELIHDDRRAFAQTGVEKEAIVSVLSTIFDKAEKMPVIQERSRKKQQEIEGLRESVFNDIESIYTNKEEQ